MTISSVDIDGLTRLCDFMAVSGVERLSIPGVVEIALSKDRLGARQEMSEVDEIMEGVRVNKDENPYESPDLYPSGEVPRLSRIFEDNR